MRLAMCDAKPRNAGELERVRRLVQGHPAHQGACRPRPSSAAAAARLGPTNSSRGGRVRVRDRELVLAEHARGQEARQRADLDGEQRRPSSRGRDRRAGPRPSACFADHRLQHRPHRAEVDGRPARRGRPSPASGSAVGRRRAPCSPRPARRCAPRSRAPRRRPSPPRRHPPPARPGTTPPSPPAPPVASRPSVEARRHASGRPSVEAGRHASQPIQAVRRARRDQGGPRHGVQRRAQRVVVGR